MRKLFTIILVMSFAYAYGQSIQLLYNNSDVVAYNDTVAVDVYEPSDYYLTLVNIASQDVDLMIVRTLIDLLPETVTYFCFENCYSSEVNATEDPYSFKAGDTLYHGRPGDTLFNGDIVSYPYFYVHYDPMGQKGISLVKFDFKDNRDISDKTSVVFKFNSNSLGITDKQKTTVSLNAYPNPATSKVFIQHDLKEASTARLHVTNLLGVRVKSIPISPTSNKTQLDISDFASGIYFYSLEIDGKISMTKKLIVK
jgi:hypothetical protein